LNFSANRGSKFAVQPFKGFEKIGRPTGERVKEIFTIYLKISRFDIE
jgi:hypothetical protein